MISGLRALGNVTISGNNGVTSLFTAFPELAAMPVADVHAIFFQAHDSNTGKVYVGDDRLNIGTDTGIIWVGVAPSTSSIPGLGIDIAVSQDGISLSQIKLGAALDGNKIRVSVLTA
jgi:hypothetical protein